jgi:argininosuccinate lyase
MMKAQPLAYNRDNQEDKTVLFDAVDTVRACLAAYTGLIPAMTVRRDAMRQAAVKGFTTATDLADYLVRKGLPFRDAHAAVGKAVQYAMGEGKDLTGLTLDELQQFNALIGRDVFNSLELQGSVAARNHIGGTAPVRVRQSVKRARRHIKNIHVREIVP